MIEHRTGDIFTTEAKSIGHGVNTAGVMGAGIALEFRNRFPKLYEGYKLACDLDDLKPGGVYVFDAPIGVTIYNIASQDLPGPNARLDWLAQGVWSSLHHVKARGESVLALPRIGSGIGGLDQDEVESLLVRLSDRAEVTIELWTFTTE